MKTEINAVENLQRRYMGEDSFTYSIPANDISIIRHEGGRDGYCRVFFSFTDYIDFSLEHPQYKGVAMSFILESMDNLPKLSEYLSGCEKVFSYQCRYLDGHRFIWAHGYDCRNSQELEEFFREFSHDHVELIVWQPDREILPVSET